MYNKIQSGKPFYVTATHATAAVASKAAVATKTHVVTGYVVSSDKAGAIVLVKDDTTVIWQAQVGAGVHGYTFPVPLFGAKGNLVSVEIDGTSACKANLVGVSI